MPFSDHQNTMSLLSNEELVLHQLVYALNAMERARQAIDERDVITAHNHIVLAENLIGELRGILPPGSQVDSILRPFYTMVIRRLFIANLTKKPGSLDDPIAGMSIMVDKWKQVIDYSRDMDRINVTEATHPATPRLK